VQRGCFLVSGEVIAIFGPEGFGGIKGSDGQITVMGGAVAATIARWSIRRVGTNPDGSPRLRFRAHFSWRNDVLMKMCGRGELIGRVRVFMLGTKGKEQIDVVNWDEWIVDEDGALTLENVLHFDTAPLGITRGSKA
jgi:hypothetical protein